MSVWSQFTKERSKDWKAVLLFLWTIKQYIDFLLSSCCKCECCYHTRLCHNISFPHLRWETRWEVDCVWWASWHTLDWEYELSYGWQQSAHAHQRRENLYAWAGENRSWNNTHGHFFIIWPLTFSNIIYGRAILFKCSSVLVRRPSFESVSSRKAAKMQRLK